MGNRNGCNRALLMSHLFNLNLLQPFEFPDYTGLPIFSTTEDTYYMLEMHYDNADYKKGIVVT
jgi:hypothetical protein